MTGVITAVLVTVLSETPCQAARSWHRRATAPSHAERKP